MNKKRQIAAIESFLNDPEVHLRYIERSVLYSYLLDLKQNEKRTNKRKRRKATARIYK
jgi:hypothetical protein